MTNQKATYLAPAVIEADREALVGLKTLEGYAPSNPQFSVQAIAESEATLRAAEEAEVRMALALSAARDARDAAAGDLHSRVQGAKTAVLSQYGPESDAVQAIGLKKKSDYRKPARRVAAK